MPVQEEINKKSLGNSNMYYCMFANTYNDLVDIVNWGGFESKILQPREKEFRNKMIILMKDILQKHPELV